MKETLFIVIPVLLLLTGFIVWYFLFRRKKVTTETILGKKCVVTVEIDNFAGRGQVSVAGESWACRSLFDEELIEVGEKVIVVALEGAKLVCKKV